MLILLHLTSTIREVTIFVFLDSLTVFVKVFVDKFTVKMAVLWVVAPCSL
jgi:hypothetical protein